MNLIISILSHLWILLCGVPTEPTKVRLDKQPSEDEYREILYSWIERNFNYIALAFLLLLLLTFVTICFALCGISATESGTMRNFINGGMI